MTRTRRVLFRQGAQTARKQADQGMQAVFEKTADIKKRFRNDTEPLKTKGRRDRTRPVPVDHFALKVIVTVADTQIFAACTTVAASISFTSAPVTLREKLLTPLSKL